MKEYIRKMKLMLSKMKFGLLVGTCLLFYIQTANAASEYQVKASLLYNLSRMVKWPDESVNTATDNFTFCFMGEEPFGDALKLIQDKKIRHRPIVLIKEIALGQVDKCKVLFISESEQDRLEKILQALTELPLLTIGDTDGFAQHGVMVNLVQKNNKIELEINRQAIQSTQLNVSSTLFKLATIVDTADTP